MKRYLLVLLGMLVVASGLAVGYGYVGYVSVAPIPTPMPTLSPLSAYLEQALPVMERHGETAEIVAKATETLNAEAEKPSPDDPSKTQSEAIDTPRPIPVGLSTMTNEELRRMLSTPMKPGIPPSLRQALTERVNTLEWALERVDYEVVDWVKLTPPPGAQHFHSLLLSYLKKERAAWQKLLSYDLSILSKGYGDEKELDQARILRLEARVLWLEASQEFDKLTEG